MATIVPPMHQPSRLSLVLARRTQRLAHGPRQLIADVVVEAHVGVLVAGLAPVEQEHVVALLEQELDERVARTQVEDRRAG